MFKVNNKDTRMMHHGGVLHLVKLQAEACNFTKSNTPPWIFFTFFKLNKWQQRSLNYTNGNKKQQRSLKNL